MDKLVTKIKENFKRNIIIFDEPYFISKDKKSILGEVSFKEILFLEYRDTEAGSNPREYTGLKKSNENIIKSLLKDYNNMFRFLHSGVIISIINPKFENNNSILYDHCCLTNGNQTRFIILILVLLKILYEDAEIYEMSMKKLKEFVNKNFEDAEKALEVLGQIKIAKVNEIIRFLRKNTKYYNSYKNFDVNDFLNSKIRIQVNLLDTIVEDLEDSLDEYAAGTLIAEANNDTQNVRADDIFGNKYKGELEKYIFDDFLKKYGETTAIEYRLGELTGDKRKVHILLLLRLVIPSGILTKEKDIFNLTNKRNPVYKLFAKLLGKDSKDDVVKIVSKLIPLLYNIRTNYVEELLPKYKRDFIRDYKEKAMHGDLGDSIINKEIQESIDDDDAIEKLIKKNVNYNIEHILPVIIYRVRNLIKFDDVNDKCILTIPDKHMDKFFKTLVKVVYENYVKNKLKGLRTSLTTLVRSEDFYEAGSETYEALVGTLELQETNFVYEHRKLIK